MSGDSLGALKQGSRIQSDWIFDIKDEVKIRKQVRAKKILSKISAMPSSYKRFGVSREAEGRSVFKKLNTSLIEDNPPMLTAVEMLKNITEVEKLLPRDTAYDTLKETRSFKPKRGKRKN